MIWNDFADRIEKLIFTKDKHHGYPSDIRILEMWELCNRYRCLPEAGGLFDQDPEIMAKFSVIDEKMGKKAQYDQMIGQIDAKAKAKGMR